MKINPKIYIIGSGGHAQVLKSMITEMGHYSFGGFIEDDITKCVSKYSLLESDFLTAQKNQEPNILLGIGDRSQKVNVVVERFLPTKANFPTLIHHTSAIDKTAVIENGSVCLPLSSVKANSFIGAYSIINNNSVVGHDSKLSQFVHLSLGAIICGNSRVGENTLIGANATILPGITIGKNCVIGAGAVVTKDVSDNEIWFGNPAKRFL